MSKRLRIWMMAGGTGGHIVPGLAVAQALRDDGCEVLWLGNVDRMEGRLVPPAGFTMINIGFAGVRGKGLLHKLRTPFSLAWWVLRVLLRMLRQRPDAVIGMGGYVSVPGGLSAWLLRVPLVLHEQNAIAGMSNRYLAKFATRVLTGFPNTLPDATWTGNPVRETFLNAPSPETRYGEREGALRVLVVGGSLGAAALNEVVPQAVAQLAPDVRPDITHQSGEAHLTQLQKNYDDAGVSAECVAFIDDMAAAMAQADLLVCRAGAMTVAEVAAMGVAALFVPFPFAVDDHQTANASWLVDNEAAFLQQQSSLSVEWLAQWLGEQTREALRDVAQRAHSFAKPDATRDIAQACLQSARRAS